MYLAVKQKDYPYHMANIFKKELKKETGWNEEKLRYLRSIRDRNQLVTILKKMEEEGFLESIKVDSIRHIRYYNLKIDILSSPFANIDIRRLYYDFSKNAETQKDEYSDKELARNFLSKLGNNDIHDYFVIWSGIDKFDFITFLGFIKKEAENLKDTDMTELIRRNIYDTQRHEKIVADLISHSELIDKMESENRKRKIYRERFRNTNRVRIYN